MSIGFYLRSCFNPEQPGTSLTLCSTTWLTLLEARSPGDFAAFLVDPSQESLVVDDVPDPAVDLLEPDVLAVQGLTQEDLARVQSEAGFYPTAAEQAVAADGRSGGSSSPSLISTLVKGSVFATAMSPRHGGHVPSANRSTREK